MKYFRLLPTINYGDAVLRNIFNKYILTSPIENKYLFTRILNEHETLKDIAYDEYGDPELWWVLAIINDIRDIIFDLPLDDDTLQNIARDMATENGSLNTALYVEKYNQLQEENDNKRVLKILKSEFINQFLSDVLDSKPTVS